MPVFTKFNAGKFLSLIWSYFAFFMIMFYCAVLRAALITPLKEKPVDSTGDAVRRNLDIFILNPIVLVASGKLELLKFYKSEWEVENSTKPLIGRAPPWVCDAF